MLVQGILVKLAKFQNGDCAVIFHETGLSGAFLIEIEGREDSRGLFGRSFCAREFQAQKLISQFVQCNVSFNKTRGILRGMHFQSDPKPEVKLVRCTRGEIFDVIVDLRKNSATYCQWKGFHLTETNRNSLYVPAGFAHGFQVLSDQSEVFYQMSEFYEPELSGGVRWNDPAFSIQWPISNPFLSPKDSEYADFKP